MQKIKQALQLNKGLTHVIAIKNTKKSKSFVFIKNIIAKMEESVLSGFTTNYIIGECEPNDKLRGFKAESFLKRVLRENDAPITTYLMQKYNIAPFKYQLPNTLQEKYRRFLADKDARQHILDKYAEKLSVVDMLCFRLVDLDAKGCIKLLEDFKQNQNVTSLVDNIVADYKNELKTMF